MRSTPDAVLLRFALAAAGLAAVTTPLRAQCPDGTPPPCRAAPAAAAPRRADPPLDDRTWIVLPFNNLSRSADIDWLRDASVNLLYMDLSRWRDIRVVDDERVADLLRDVPDVRASQSPSLAVGLAVARRAGAGKLVMGDLLRVGSRTSVTAKVFDVRTGARLRSPHEETAVSDSIIPMFGKLARGILAVPPPADEKVGAIGTQNLSAYQEYLAGVRALNSFDLAAAKPHLDSALKLDSTFALAHYKFAIMAGWETAGSPAIRPHAEAAARYAASLPARERTLIAGFLAFSTGDYGRSCEAYRTLVRADSSDVEALYGLGDCSFHDREVEPVPGDTTRLRFRSSGNATLWAFRRVLALDPTYHLAIQHPLDILTTELRPGCRRPAPGSPCAFGWVAAVRRDGDSLVTVPTHPAANPAAYIEQVAEASRTSARRRNLEEARTIAQDWVAAGPAEPRAHSALAHVLLLLGDVNGADQELKRVAGVQFPPAERARVLIDRLEIAVKRERYDEAARLLDTLRLGIRTNADRVQFALVEPLTGRFSGFDSLMAEALRTPGMPPEMLAYQRLTLRLVLGVPAGDSAVALERQVFALPQARPGCGAGCATLNISAGLMYGLRVARAAWPALDVSANDRRLAPAAALARGDTSGFRAAVLQLDSVAAASSAAGLPDNGSTFIAAESFLLLGDSLAALRRTRRMLDTTFMYSPLVTSVGPGTVQLLMLVPRAMLLRADLAAALGARDEARAWYKRFLDLWAHAAPEFQPVVERARKAWAAVGGT